MLAHGVYGPELNLGKAHTRDRRMFSRPLAVSAALVASLFVVSTGLPSTGMAISTLIIPGVGVGPVRLGMSLSQVSGLLGRPNPPAQEGQLKFPQWAMTVRVEGGIVVRVGTASPLFRTTQGAGVGVSLGQATHLIGDLNEMLATTDNTLTVVYFFRGVGFVFRADRAVEVFVVPPLRVEPSIARILPGTPAPSQPSQSGGVLLGSGAPGGVGGAPGGGAAGGGGAPGGGVAGGGGAPGGGAAGGGGAPGEGVPGGGGATGGGGSNTGTSGGAIVTTAPVIPVSTSTLSPHPVQSSSLDPANGNLLVNGSPYLLIQATNMDIPSWAQAGYTEVQANAKLAQMQQAGYNTIFGNWGTVSSQYLSTIYQGVYQDVYLWQQYGFYWHGGADLDDLSPGGFMAKYWLSPGTPDYTKMVHIVSRFKDRPNLLIWWIADELNEFHVDSQGNMIPGNVSSFYQPYCFGIQNMSALDPTRLVGDTYVDMAQTDLDQNLACAHIMWVEEVFDGNKSGPYSGPGSVQPTGNAGNQIYHLWDGLRRENQAWTDGDRFVLGASTTPIPEKDTWPTGNPNFTWTQDDPVAMHRYFMLQVAMNTRTFDVLWGANQRGPTVPKGDLNASYVNVWNYSLNEVNIINSLGSVILAPGRWEQLKTSPAFQFGVGPSGNDGVGVYAWKKTVNGITYVIALNMSTTQNVSTGLYTEHPITGATINVGQTINSISRMFPGYLGESQSPPSYGGSVITDDFAIMQVHVYEVH